LRRPASAPARRGASPKAGTTRPALVLTVPSETSFLGLVREVTRKMAETAGFDLGTADQLALAVDEAATNVIEHAYRGAPDREVEIRLEDRGPEFKVEVVDSGNTVDPRAVPDVDLGRYVKERRTGGLPGRLECGAASGHRLGEPLRNHRSPRIRHLLRPAFR